MDDFELERAVLSLREANSSTPPSSPSGSLNSSSIFVDSEEVEADPVIVKQILMVEDQLIELVARQRELKGQVCSPVLEQPTSELPIHKEHAYPCRDTHNIIPSHPSKWPQAPIMLRPTPNTSMRIRGIRHANSYEYEHFKGFCAGCILPINTGAELPGESLVIDFESNHFVGTILMRIKEASPNVKESQSNESYFDGKKRRFQAIVKGKFKMPLSLSKCVTGQIFDRPAGKLPAKWIVSTFVKFVSAIAPQLEATIDGTTPKFLTPLCATAHTILCKPDQSTTIPIYDGDDEKLKNYNIYQGSRDIETNITEPSANDPNSLLQTLPSKQTDNGMSGTVARQKTRKKVMNYVAASKADDPKFELDKEYTFEFYQHLLLFGENFAVDMGAVVGKVQLAPCTDGQPLKFMAAVKTNDGALDYLWCFDIWHESLYSYSLKSDMTKYN